MSCPRACVLLAISCGLLCFPPTTNARQKTKQLSSSDPVWQIDLRKFGYEAWTRTKAERLITTYWIDGIGFTDNQTIAVAWLTLDNSSGVRISEKHPPAPEPAHLHAIFLDAATGTKKEQTEWPTMSFPVRFLTTYDGQFLICTAQTIQLFSSSLQLLRSLPVSVSPSDRGCASPFKFAQVSSPSARSILFPSEDRGTKEEQLLNTESFATVSLQLHGIRAFSDDWVIGTCGKPSQTCIARTTDEGWHPFGAYSPNRAAGFLNNTTVLIATVNGGAVLALDGSQRFTFTLPDHEFISRVITSVDGQRFAVLADRLRGLTSPTLDMYPFASNDRVIVYNITDGHAVFDNKVKGTSPWMPSLGSLNETKNQPALSPDGTLLAILSSAQLMLYKIP